MYSERGLDRPTSDKFTKVQDVVDAAAKLRIGTDVVDANLHNEGIE
jgi:hypothetical protein